MQSIADDLYVPLRQLARGPSGRRTEASPRDIPKLVIEVGATIAGKYRVERVLGRGGMGYVLQAFHEQLGESVAIKFMVPELACYPDAVGRFLREARASFRIRSEHVARVLDVGEHAGAPFIVMELLSGHDLATEIAERYVPSEEAVGFMLQICEALAAAHALGIVHRDIKPSNLFLTRRSDGTPLIKVLDFGISKALEDPIGGPSDSLTVSQRLLGSPYYMSPEQARSAKSADARSDIWSLGVVLYELVLGERPFRGDTAVAILASLLSDTVSDISDEQRSRMPDELMQVILRCLNRDPNLRFADVAELARALLPMAAPNSELVVGRIERMARSTPALDNRPADSPSKLPPTHGSTLVSARSSVVGGTSSTHLIDPLARPLVRRAYGPKTLALVAVIAALGYWFGVRGLGARHDLGTAPSAQGDRIEKRDGPSGANIKQQEAAAPPASQATTTASALPSAAPAEPLHAEHKTNARPQSARTPGAATSASTAISKDATLPSGPARPVSTADPKNQPE